MSIFVRFITGFALGFELMPAEGVYLHLYLGIAEVVFVNPKLVEDE